MVIFTLYINISRYNSCQSPTKVFVVIRFLIVFVTILHIDVKNVFVLFLTAIISER